MRNHMQMQIYMSKLLLPHGPGILAAVPEARAAADPVESWRSLNAAHAAIRTALDSELRREHDLSAVEFEVLECIAGCGAGKVRMQEISSFAHLTQSTASRVVARLEDEGLAKRAMCSDDRRGIFAAVTEAGRERVAAAEPTYRRVISEKLSG
jgi:DNA-binding MarR family transcriptional regulator